MYRCFVAIESRISKIIRFVFAMCRVSRTHIIYLIMCIGPKGTLEGNNRRGGGGEHKYM
jgi:hypothetical protein